MTLTALVVVSFAFMSVAAMPDDASARKCFGKKVNRVIKGKNKTVRLSFKDVTWIAGNKITAIGKPYSRICADRGRQFVRAGKGKSRTSTGRGNDRINLHPSSHLNVVQAGLGNDVIRGSNGNDILYGGPKKNPKGKADRDTIYGLRGNDRIYDYSGENNRLYGVTGTDSIYSLGDAVSSVYGGNGSDFIYANGGLTSAGRSERLFGERGNDHLNGNRSPSRGPVFLDGGSGDDWLNGTSFDDTAIVHSGIVKIKMGAGNDLVVATSAGRVSVDGGTGLDTLSWATHTPSAVRNFTGIRVDLGGGDVGGVGVQSLERVEDIIGSSFDDEITGKPGVTNYIFGGIGDDTLVGQLADGDSADGGLGQNECSGFGETVSCGKDSPGNTNQRDVLVDINESGVLTVMGSTQADDISVGYDAGMGNYRVEVNSSVPVISGLCTSLSKAGRTVTCPASFNNLNGVLAYGNDGADRIEIEGSVPKFVTTTINGGSGRNTLIGGKSKDVISTEAGSEGSIIRGGGNLDQLYVPPEGIASGGGSADVIHSKSPCDGGTVRGGSGADNLVLNGSARGVKANLAKGFARFVKGKCSKQLKIGRDVENLEGTSYDDVLILGKKLKTQNRKRSLLGRDGHDVLNSRNGYPDTVTTGGGGRGNKVISDRKDKVTWGWGLARF